MSTHPNTATSNNATIFLVLAAVGGLIFAGLEIHFTRNAEKIKWTYELIKRLDDPQILNINSETMYFLINQNLTESQKLYLYNGAGEKSFILREKISLALGIFEDMGYMYNRGKLDEKMTEDLLKEISISTYNYANWFIKYLREKQGDDLIYIEWKTMNDDFKDQEKNPLCTLYCKDATVLKK